MPMIAFIGVRISWLIAARNALLAWFASSAARRASCASAKSRALSIAIGGLLGEADEEVEVGAR